MALSFVLFAALSVWAGNPNLLMGVRRTIGAGEAIRTLDPNLGKVMLYP